MSLVKLIAFALVAMVSGEVLFKYRWYRDLPDQNCHIAYTENCIKGQDKCCTGMCVTDVGTGMYSLSKPDGVHGRCCFPEPSRVSKAEYAKWTRNNVHRNNHTCKCDSQRSNDAYCQQYDEELMNRARG
ncbi:hypothetical protein HDE_08637 [Halotydeus destructor]|nr:hypothetical protein HDE_08637 [Halotydeus destructor]